MATNLTDLNRAMSPGVINEPANAAGIQPMRAAGVEEYDAQRYFTVKAITDAIDALATAASTSGLATIITHLASLVTALDGVEGKLDTLNTNADRVADALELQITTRGGETALDGSNPTPVVTGLSAITAVSLVLNGSVAPGVGTSVLTYTKSGGTISVYAWKVTGLLDVTLIASTGTETFSWLAVGTA